MQRLNEIASGKNLKTILTTDVDAAFLKRSLPDLLERLGPAPIVPVAEPEPAVPGCTDDVLILGV